MNKNIILLSDGTGNGAAKRHKTNVWRLYDALDLHREDQVAFYDDGVGSQEFLPFKLIGGIFGWGLKRNVRELYKFLCRNYDKGDRIYLFGFSRGAFTVRVLAGMIVYCGIYNGSKREQELEQAARHNYNAYRSKFKAGLLTRGLRAFLGKKKAKPTEHHPPIEFIGVWDTVSAYGLPIAELADFWNFWIYPIRFPDYKLASKEKVKKACHALSVDDERLTFHPELWDESKEPDPHRIEQVWFPGVHSDVGGGYPKHSLSLVALDWMIAKAAARDDAPGSPGLHLIEQRRREFTAHSDWHGPQHDSRAMAGAYYRYAPRDIGKLCNDPKKKIRIERPKIHRSVMERIAGVVTPYAPTGLPERYEVVSTDGTPRVYETADSRKKRKAAMKQVQSVIGQRQWLYRAMLFVSLFFLISPLLFGCVNGAIPDAIKALLPGFIKDAQCTPQDGLFDPLLAWAVKILPDFISPWIEVLRNKPIIFYALIAFAAVFIRLKSMAWAKTRELAIDAWSGLKNADKVDVI